jgi:hypothetical protein
MIRLLDHSFSGAQRMMEDKICQIGVLQRHRAHEQRFSSARIRSDIRLLSSTAILGMLRSLLYVFK